MHARLNGRRFATASLVLACLCTFIATTHAAEVTVLEGDAASLAWKDVTLPDGRRGHLHARHRLRCLPPSLGSAKRHQDRG